ncbi:hypothetical protein [Corynebacterium sp. AOP12-C2-36]|uniref:hypothetical protein n=1 Tax=Corynebacterium sp. AOP12-C2-36 TaxID=3457723 RepID=UPI004033EBA5
MTDATPMTNDDRRSARLWAEKVDPAEVNPGYIGTPRDIYNAARVILATVPAPPATLADELREWARSTPEEGAHWDEWDDFNALADRAEAVEKHNEEVVGIVDDLTEQRDEARAEVERLTASLNRQCTTATPSVHNTDVLTVSSDTLPDRAEVGSLTSGRTVRESRTVALPDPADVPKGEPWLVTVSGAQGIGFRHGDTMYAWGVAYEDGIDGEDDSSITLVSRLVPDVRRVIDRPEDLDKLPVGSIVIDMQGDAWQVDEGAQWNPAMYSQQTDKENSQSMVAGHLTVTVIHEPEVTA